MDLESGTARNPFACRLLLAVLVIGLLIGLLSSCSSNTRKSATYLKKDFEAFLVGKTKQDVRAILGQPDRVSSNSPLSPYDDAGSWIYGMISGDRRDWRNPWVVYEEDSGICCWYVNVMFVDEKVARVHIDSCRK